MKPQKDINFGTLINGSWTGMIGEIQRKVKPNVCSYFLLKDYRPIKIPKHTYTYA